MAGIARAKGSQVHEIGGIEDHIHLFISLPTTLALCKLIEHIKKGSSKWIKTKGSKHVDFAWQSGYGAFSIGQSSYDDLRKYIQTQKDHHQKISFKDEYRIPGHRPGYSQNKTCSLKGCNKKNNILSSLGFYLIFTLSLLLSACTESPPTLPLNPMQEIKGRDYDHKRFNVYRARVPLSWVRKDSLADESLTDTKKSICEFFIIDDKGIIRITIHNFPSNTLEERIPPAAQVARWERQFDLLLPEESVLLPQAYNGYSGLKFKGVGMIDQKETMMLGWSLQIGQEHFQMLSHPKNPANNDLYREMRGDVTIKATGPKDIMEEHEEAISSFARSFELIQEIPSRS